jgi:hypothetical protein
VTRHALAALVVLGFTCSTAGAQPAITTGIDADVVRDLPTNDTIFSILETTEPSLISDRISTGGAYTGQAPKIGGFFSSFSQTLFQIGDVSLSDPTGSGAPLLLPDPELWGRIGITTGMMPVSVNAAGVAIALDPRAPSAKWTTSLSGTGGFPASAPGSGPPAVVRADGWDRASATASGPLLTDAQGTTRLAGFFAASWTRGRDAFPVAPTVSTTMGSGFAHLVFTPNAGNDIHGVGWVQKINSGDDGAHVQASWEHGSPDGPRFRVFAAYTQRVRQPDSPSLGAAFERLTDGPLSQLAYISRSRVSQWTVGARLPDATAGIQTIDGGVEIGGARDTSSAFSQGTVGETVNGIPARLWVFQTPAAPSSSRHITTVNAYVADHLALSPKLVVGAGVRFDAVTGSATGATGQIRWQSWLPRATAEWTLVDTWQPKIFGGVSRSAYRLPLDVLAIGDPGAPTANIFQWPSLPGAPLDIKAIGQMIARVGPGSGGDAAFAQIDPNLKRPTTDEVAIGVSAQPSAALHLRAVGFLRRERNLIELTDTGTPATAFTLTGEPDPGLQLQNPADDQLLPVYGRTAASFGLDRYLLTNRRGDDATSKSVEISAELKTQRVILFGGLSANQSVGPAASVGFGPLENDQDGIGDVYVDPNSATFASGRIFSDRAYTIKLSTVLRLPKDIHVGIVGRYQDGQPFSRLVLATGLNQGVEAIRAFPNGRSRFTFAETVDARIQKSFPIGRDTLDVVFDMFNLLDTKNEVEEQTVSGAAFRDVTAIQPPRTVHAGFRFNF